nr:MAG TPA: hypothetical protein [Caudoviricetes sp.]
MVENKLNSSFLNSIKIGYTNQALISLQIIKVTNTDYTAKPDGLAV